VHRDLKQSNVLIAEDGPRVIDFGISGAVESTTLTQAGLVIGSPGFMSPQQAAGFGVDPPSDTFSLGRSSPSPPLARAPGLGEARSSTGAPRSDLEVGE
jgi:serine/threonine protein kinase